MSFYKSPFPKCGKIVIDKAGAGCNHLMHCRQERGSPGLPGLGKTVHAVFGSLQVHGGSSAPQL